MGRMRWKMRDVHFKNSSTCRTLVNHQNPQPYFVSITVSQPKIRVKIPKLLLKAMEVRKSNQVGGAGGGVCSESSNETPLPHNQMKTTMKKKKKTKRGLSSLFAGVFGTKKPSKKDEMGDQDKKLAPMFKRHTLKEYFEAAKDDEHKREKKNMLTFIKEKVKKKKKKKKNAYSVGNDVETASICSSSCSGRLPRVRRRVRTTRDKSRMGRSSRKMSSKRLGGVSGENGGRTESSRDKELCKKRILMGEKCKPLNYSGTLQYDKDGMLLPEIFSW